MSLQPFDRFWWNLAWWRTLVLTADRPLKFRIFENPRPGKYTRRVDLHVDNFHQVWSWYYHPLPSYSVFVCWYVTWPDDHDLWPIDLEQLSFMAGHVINPATKFEDPTTILSWVTSYNGSHWLPFKMRTRPLRVRRITQLNSTENYGRRCLTPLSPHRNYILS